MIGVSGQYVLNFSLADQTDFIQEADLIAFTLIEDAGNSLPTYSLSFETTNEDILHYMNERNTLFVSYGRDNNSLITTKLAIGTVQISRNGNDKRQISIAGTYSALPYQGDSKISISSNKSGIAVIKDVVSPYFKKIDSNISKSNDSQRWIQYNITDRKFVFDIWPHCHIPNSFISMGITSSGTCVLKDIKKSFNDNPKWKLCILPSNKKDDILTDGNAHVSFSSGLVNTWLGYDREDLTYTLEDDVGKFHLEQAGVGLANTKNVSKDPNITKRFNTTNIINDNVHAEYWSAYKRNLSYLAQYSSLKLGVTFSNTFYPIQLLDLVMYSEDALGASNQSASYHTGLYLVSKVSRTVANRNIRTLVHLVRESPNQVK